MKNRYEVRGDTTVIFIVRRNGEVHEMLIDTEDLCLFIGGPNVCYINAYAFQNIPQVKRIYRYIHRFLTDPAHDECVDHINHNTLDNRRINLRIASSLENSQNLKGPSINNTSGVLGVGWDASRDKWRAQIQVNGINKSLGRFISISDAEAAVKEARAELHPFSKEGMERAQNNSLLHINEAA